jgi:hypothetical protein
MGPDGAGARELVTRGFDGPAAVWAPDSSALAFSKLAGSPRRYDAFVVDLEGVLTRLTDTRAEESVESWQAVPTQ